MKTKCDELRETLTSMTEEQRRHLDECPACRRYAGRAAAAKRYFENHRSDATPDASFAARVAGRVNGSTAGAMGWAAMRLLPATAVLAVILAWFAFQAAPSQETAAVVSPTEDLLSWVLDEAEAGQ
jgi:predicted anti-sigma-YlaC factor YlaD